jgi:PAS domain S-box-containing protein
LDFSATVIDYEGRPSGRAIAIDITDRKLTEMALRESERRFREILENVRLASLLLDTEGVVTYANEYLLELLGYEEEEIVGREWFKLFVPPDQREALRRSFFEKIPLGMVAPQEAGDVLTRDGERRLISWTNTILRDPEGRVVGTASLGVDVTERNGLDRVSNKKPPTTG